MNKRPAFFDENSLYNRFREGFAPGQKVYGFFEYRAFEASEPKAIQLAPAGQRTKNAAGARSAPTGLAARGQVPLLVLSAQSPGVTEGGKKVSVRVRRLARRTTLKAEIAGLLERSTVRGSRILLVHRKSLDRLRKVAPSLDPEDDEKALRTLITDEMLTGNPEVARLVANLPDLDGHWQENRIEAEIPDNSPDLTRDTYVVVVLDVETP